MSNNQENKKGIVLKKEKYSIEIKYSPEAIEKKLMKFTTPNGESFEISAEEMISMLVNQVNTEVLLPTFVDVDKVNVVQVRRQMKAILTEDKKVGDTILIDYIHPYPIEFAILEEAYKIAVIELIPGRLELTKEFIDSVKVKLQPEMEKYIKEFYRSFTKLDLESKKAIEEKAVDSK